MILINIHALTYHIDQLIWLRYDFDQHPCLDIPHWSINMTKMISAISAVSIKINNIQQLDDDRWWGDHVDNDDDDDDDDGESSEVFMLTHSRSSYNS